MSTSGARLRLLDDGKARDDLSLRRESKYVFTNFDVATLRTTLRRSCTPIVYGDRVSKVASIYFDDPRLSACRANLDGVGLRHKTRLRWYDQPYPGDHFFYEKKWRRHRATGKHRLRIGNDSDFQSTPLKRLHAALRRTIPDPYTRHLYDDTEAVVLVEYDREHFALDGSGARFTLDYNIRFYPQLFRRCLSRRFVHRLSGVALIECKHAPTEHAAVHGALRPLPARKARFSKYVTGCEQLGYISIF
ncbi:MAG: VTC domain-containing protein [Planctomycetota bacterium]